MPEIQVHFMILFQVPSESIRKDTKRSMGIGNDRQPTPSTYDEPPPKYDYADETQGTLDCEEYDGC